MRYAFIAVLTVALMPAVAQAGSKFNFFFGFGSGGYCSPYYGYASYGYYRPYYGYYRPSLYYKPYPYYGYKPYYGGFKGRYAVPKVYSPYRYGDYRSDYWRDYAYRRDYNYRNDLYRYDRAPSRAQPYYGPAVERYRRDARNYPSYHYDRREAYNRAGRVGTLDSRNR